MEIREIKLNTPKLNDDVAVECGARAPILMKELEGRFCPGSSENQRSFGLISRVLVGFSLEFDS